MQSTKKQEESSDEVNFIVVLFFHFPDPSAAISIKVRPSTSKKITDSPKAKMMEIIF